MDETRRSMLARLGLLAGGVGAALLGRPDRADAQTLGETVDIAPPGGDAALKLRPSGPVAPSTSAGGALNLDNSASQGAGAVLYSNQGANALGRLLVVNQAHPGNPQQAVRIQNSGTAHTVSILHDPAGGAGDSTAEAVDIVSTNPLDTTLGVQGQEEGRGTVKITHEKPVRPDANAAALSIALQGEGTACQGIFIGNDAGNPTTGKLLNIRNGGAGAKRLALTADGKLELPVPGPDGGVAIADTSIYRSAPGVLATDGGMCVGGRLVLTSVDQAIADGTYTIAQVAPGTAISLGPGGALRGLGVAARISVSGALGATSLSMCNLSSVVTPSAPTDLKSVEVYKSSPQIDGLPGVTGGVSGSSFSSFLHQLRLSPIDRGTGTVARVCGLYVPPTGNSVGAGWTVPNYSGVRIEPPGGDGAITQLTGIDIRDFKGRGAANYSLRSFGSAVEMRHSGAVSLGAQEAPDTLLHLHGNGVVHGSLTVEAEGSDPAPPRAGAQARLYVKNGKLVIQWNDTGTVLYTTIPLDSRGPYPVTPAVTTDTVAP